MKGSKLLLLVAVLLLATIGAAMSEEVVQVGKAYLFPNVNPIGLTQYLPFKMQQGWVNSQLAWYICTDASDQKVACDSTFAITPGACAEYYNGLTYAPKLANAAGSVAIMYVFTNINQGPVFTAMPGDPNYSGLWQVVYVTFNPGVTPFCVNNANPYNPVTNPHGLPGPDLATQTVVNRAGLPIVVKCPIMAIGQLGGPWYPGIPGVYRIPQAKVRPDYAYTKIIWLPFWNVYCSSFVTKAVMVRQIIVPDVYDPTGALTAKLGANNAPGLVNIPGSAEQPMYWITNTLLQNQYPVLHACPETPVPLSPGAIYQMFTIQEFVGSNISPCQNQNPDYSPVDVLFQLRRNPTMPISTVVNNEPTLLRFLAGGCLSQLSNNVILNAPVLPEPPAKHPVIPPPPPDNLH